MLWVPLEVDLPNNSDQAVNFYIDHFILYKTKGRPLHSSMQRGRHESCNCQVTSLAIYWSHLGGFSYGDRLKQTETEFKDKRVSGFVSRQAIQTTDQTLLTRKTT